MQKIIILILGLSILLSGCGSGVFAKPTANGNNYDYTVSDCNFHSYSHLYDYSNFYGFAHPDAYLGSSGTRHRACADHPLSSH